MDWLEKRVWEDDGLEDGGLLGGQELLLSQHQEDGQPGLLTSFDGIVWTRWG